MLEETVRRWRAECRTRGSAGIVEELETTRELYQTLFEMQFGDLESTRAALKYLHHIDDPDLLLTAATFLLDCKDETTLKARLQALVIVYQLAIRDIDQRLSQYRSGRSVT